MALETRSRAWVKSLVWRILGIFILGVISWVITRDLKEMTIIHALFHGIRLILYYFHERIWDKVNWGRIKHPLSILPVDRELTPADLNKVRNQLKDLGYLE